MINNIICHQGITPVTEICWMIPSIQIPEKLDEYTSNLKIICKSVNN